jgi:hypothetical protein
MVINERRKYKIHYKLLYEIHEYHTLKIHWGVGPIMYKMISMRCYSECIRYYTSCRCKIWKDDGYYKLVIYGKNSKSNEISFLGNDFRIAWARICDIRENGEI